MASNEITLEKIFLILRIRLWWIVGIFITGVVLATLITLQMPKMYTGTTSLNFDFSGNNPLDDRGRVLTQDSYLSTQVGILQSLNVAQRVTESLSDYERERVLAALHARTSKLDIMKSRVKRFIKSLFTFGGGRKESGGNEEPLGNPSDSSVQNTLTVEDPYDWLAGGVASGLSVTPLSDTRIVQVTYQSTDPKIAAVLSNRFAEAYIETNLKMVTDPARKTKVWFDEQLKLVRSRLEEAQAKLTAYQQQEGIVSSDQRIDVEVANLSSLASQLATAQQTRRDEETEQNKLNEVLAKGASLMTFEPVFQNPVVQRLKTDIRGIEAQLAESSNSLGSNHPRIKKLKAEFAAANQRLNREIKSIVDGINNAVELSRERETALEEAMEKQKQLVLKLKNEHDKMVVLQRDVDSAQSSYNAALNQLNTTSMQSMVDQTNVSIIDRASVPSYHSSPRIAKNIAVGGFGGLVIGVGFALLLELLRRRVHSDEDIIDELGIPLLGHLNKY